MRYDGVKLSLRPSAPDFLTHNINGKIQRAEQMKVHTMFVIGKRDMEANVVSVRVHGKGNLGAKPRAEVMADLLAAIRERRSLTRLEVLSDKLV